MNKLSILPGLLLFLISFSPVYAADTYPYLNGNRCGIEGCVNDGWGFYTRQCTSYAAWKMREAGINFYNHMPGPNGLGNVNNKFGNAHNWDDQAAEIGMAVDNTPMWGDIAVFEHGVHGASSMGHVAFVETVNNNGSVNISEYNGTYPHNYGLRNNLFASAYIHLLSNEANACGTTDVIVQNRTIDNGATFACPAYNSVQVSNPFHAQYGSNVHLYIY